MLLLLPFHAQLHPDDYKAGVPVPLRHPPDKRELLFRVLIRVMARAS